MVSNGAKGSEIIRYDEDLTATQIWTTSGMIFGLLEDKFSRLWIGTLNGICVYSQNKVNCP